MKTGLLTPYFLVLLIVARPDGGRADTDQVIPASGSVYLSDDFESGLGKWIVTGDWDTTASMYHSPSHSLTDSPFGDYPPVATDISATLANSIDLSGATEPVLTFWQKGETAPGDWLYVQRSTDGGATWSGFLWRADNFKQDTWSLVQLDLPTVDNVKIRFRLITDGQFERDGWYIDDVEIKEKDTERMPYPFSDNFESGMGNWIVSGYDWGLTDSAYHSLSHSLTDSPLGDYPPIYYMVSATLAHPIDLSGATDPVLIFWHKGETAPGDWLYVQESTDGGTTWLGYLWRADNFRQDTWLLVQLDLPTVDNVKIRFRLITDGQFERDGWYIDDVWILERDDVTGIEDEGLAACASECTLRQNHPNPFNPTTTISFTLPERVRVTLSIYDVSGRLVRTLMDEIVGEGYQERIWDGKDASGSQVGSGVYFYRLTAGDKTLTKKMILLK